MCVTQLYPTLTPQTVAHEAPLSVGFSDKNTGVGCHFLLQGIFLTQGWNPGLLRLLQSGRFFTTSTTWEAPGKVISINIERKGPT